MVEREGGRGTLIRKRLVRAFRVFQVSWCVMELDQYNDLLV